jgi:hypothetical protein
MGDVIAHLVTFPVLFPFFSPHIGGVGKAGQRELSRKVPEWE